MSKNTPCYECIDRHSGCHANCKSYIDYKKKIEETKSKTKRNPVIKSTSFIGSGLRFKRGGKK